MSTFAVGPETASALGQLKERTEIRDPQGKLLGVFTPQGLAREESLKLLFNLQEAERIAASEREDFSLEQVKEYLRSLEQQG